MNKLTSILLAFAALQCSSLVKADINLGVSDFQCPPGYSIYPHQQCELYYTCYNTEPTYLWQCRSNLLFDLVYDGCNWPEQTYCGNRTRPDQKTTTNIQSVPTEATPNSPKPTNCPDDGFYPAYTDSCNPVFYTCLDGYPFSTNCPSYGVFEPVAKKCVSPNNSACQTATPTSGTNPTVKSTTQGATVTSWTTTSAPATPPRTTIAQTTMAQTTMAQTTAAQTTPPKTTTTAGFVCPGSGNYPDPSSCSYYYTCDNGNAYHFACPSGLVFNSATGVCDWPSSVPSCSGK